MSRWTAAGAAFVIASITASCATTKKGAQPTTTLAVAEQANPTESPVLVDGGNAAVAAVEAGAAVDAGAGAAVADAKPDVAKAKATLPPGFVDEIRRVVMLHMPEIRKCYESGLDTVPGLKGSLTVAWHITAAGLVSRSSVVSTTMKYLPVEECIAQTIRTWAFKNPNAVEADASWASSSPHPDASFSRHLPVRRAGQCNSESVRMSNWIYIRAERTDRRFPEQALPSPEGADAPWASS